MDTKMRRCDRCDLLIGAGCACSLPSQPSPATPRATSGTPSWATPDSGFPPDTILISPRKVAHQPGCGHQSDSEITAPVWGWIEEPEQGLWQRISANDPARATHGNTERYAVRRCQTCDT